MSALFKNSKTKQKSAAKITAPSPQKRSSITPQIKLTNKKLTHKPAVHHTTLGIYQHGSRTYLLSAISEGNKSAFVYSVSLDGFNFPGDKTLFTVLGSTGLPLKANGTESMRVAFVLDQCVLVVNQTIGVRHKIQVATGHDIMSTKVVGTFSAAGPAVIGDFTVRKRMVAFTGGDAIRLAFSTTGSVFRSEPKPVITAQSAYSTLIPALAHELPAGILLLYYEVLKDRGRPFYTINGAMLEKTNPRRVSWRAAHSIWEQPSEWQVLNYNIFPVGITVIGGKMYSYWQKDSEVFAITHLPAETIHKDVSHKGTPLILEKHAQNPILSPLLHHFWESKATFNPAAVFAQGKVHIIYRAIGDHDMSMLGYATSSDGTHIDERHSDPVYVPTQPFEYTGKTPLSVKAVPPGASPYASGGKDYGPGISPYASGGGGYGGCEDPRLTKIGDKLYMTYVAHDGSSPPRVALTSIKMSDFLAKKWKWATPVLVSPPGVVDKNCVIFPEKIGGKYVVMHRIFPNILIDFVDDLDFDGRRFLLGEYAIAPTRTGWDSRKIGAGAPPLKTPAGWLLIYHAVDERDDGRYKMGAMILAQNDPTRVIARTTHPILVPDRQYENEGYKAGVAYPCGAVTISDTLYVYYGGADSYSCVATAPLSSFVDDLITHHSAQFARVEQVTVK